MHAHAAASKLQTKAMAACMYGHGKGSTICYEEVRTLDDDCVIGLQDRGYTRFDGRQVIAR